jgi:Sulfotransferase family
LSKVSILYLVGSGRSGSTLLSRLLELQDGYRAVGETRYLGDAETWPLECGCGQRHQDCELWGPLIARWSDPGRLRAWGEANRAAQLDQLAGYALPSKPRPGVERGLVEVRRIFETLGANGDVVVDESKTPWLGYLLANQDWADVRFVELVRDPREVIGSWLREKDYLASTPPEVASKHWLRTCVTAELIRKRTGLPWLRTPYSRLANDPQGVLSDILGRPAQGLLPADGVVAFTNAPVNHIYLSNPDKRRRGPDSVRPATKKTIPAPPSVGPWQRLATAYWDRWLANRTELNDRFG